VIAGDTPATTISALPNPPSVGSYFNEPLTGGNDLIFARFCHFFLEIRFPILLPNIPQIVLDNIAVRI